MKHFIINCVDPVNRKDQNRWAEVTALDTLQARCILRGHDILKLYDTYELVSSGAADKKISQPELLNWGGGLACA